MKPPFRHPTVPKRQRGAIAITAALWLMTIVVALGVVDVGHVWWQRRYLQGVSDMMALAAAQRLDDTCGGSQLAVANIASANGYTGTYTVSCGRYEIGSSTFTPVGAPYTTVNAVNVWLEGSVKYWFLPMVGQNSQNVAVQSTSRVVNINAFTLGTALASVQSGNSALLNSLLGSLLGSSVNLTLASYQALAAAQVKLTDLAAQLNSNGANDVVQMLATSPTLKTLLAALSGALPASDASQSALSQLIAGANTAAGGHAVPMDGSNNQNGLLDIGLDNKNGASNATIDALDALMVAAMVANSSSSGVANISLDLSTLSTVPLLGGSELKVSLGQPPVLAVGEAGTSSTIARSSQVKLLLVLNLSTAVPNSLLSLLGTGVNVTVPLYLAVGNGQATLTKTQCGAGVNDSYAQMQVQPSLVQACITPVANATQLFNAAPIGPAPSCTGNVPLATVSVLSSDALNVGLRIKVSAPSTYASAQPGATTVSFTGVGTQIVSPNPVSANSNDLGQDLASVLGNQPDSVIGGLVGGLQVTTRPAVVGILLQPLVALLEPAIQLLVQNLLATTVTGLLSTVVPPLLNLLGTQIGSATVTDLSLTCGNVQLVQ